MFNTARHAAWEEQELDNHLEGERDNVFPPVVELSNGRWFDTAAKRIIPDAEGFARYATWERTTPYWERDAAIVAWRERK